MRKILTLGGDLILGFSRLRFPDIDTTVVDSGRGRGSNHGVDVGCGKRSGWINIVDVRLLRIGVAGALSWNNVVRIDITASGIVIRGIEDPKGRPNVVSHNVVPGDGGGIGSTDRSIQPVGRGDVFLAAVIAALDAGFIIRREVKRLGGALQNSSFLFVLSFLMDCELPSLGNVVGD